MTAATTAPKFDPAILAASLNALGASTTTTAAAPAKDKATLYLAIGCLRDPDAPEGSEFNAKTDLVNLPQLFGLDNMKPDDRRAGTQEFADEQAEKNAFLQDLTEECLASMEPGEIRVLPLYVTVYRKKDDVVAAPVTQRVRRSFLG